MAAFTSGSDCSFDNLSGGFHQTTQPVSQTSSPTEQEQETSSTQATPTEDVPPEPQTDGRHWPSRQCRICLDVVHPTFEMNESSMLPQAIRPAPRVSYVSEEGGRLLRPCKCKGTQKYVHEECLQAWRLADPMQKRNYWECPTCRYRYKLERLTWGTRINSTAAQITLTIVILLITIFLLGFVADPIINLYLYDPVYTITSGGGPTGSLIFEDEDAGWAEHFGKGLAGLGLLGLAKMVLSVSPFVSLRTGGWGGAAARPNAGGTGRDRISTIGWLAIIVGVGTFLVAVWKGVRAWSRRTLEAAKERVLDVPGNDDDDTNE